MNTEEESSSQSWRTTMTDTRELDVINEALAIIDRGLGEMLHRELVSTDEVADLLLDVRTRLTQEEAPAAN
jgi:Tfp pilus assembly protein PilO